ncbi:tumor necrosis factor ligand superfamily member 18 [Trachinotus anak]|uniref:tumor necrosis factor ligand superfamily member 18 n=1 Tax=Trachinotus anak TaxID=443729 RepID=UPI0039F17366
MPQHTQHSLIHVLLLWTTILSIVQVSFIIFFFTAGHRGLSQNSTAVALQNTMQIQANNTPSVSFEDGLRLGRGKMLTFQVTDDDNSTKWLAKNPDTSLVSEKGAVLTIKKDGYYFLYLQVTLCACQGEYTVSLNWNTKVLLQGQIYTKTCSTGLLGKAQELFAGGTLEVIIGPNNCINTSDSLTHLDIIYMRKP